MESWDVLDSEGNKTGKRITRDKICLQKGEYHKVVHIWVLNKRGQFLIQKRSEDRDFMPGEWAATSGSVLSDESSLSAAVRELSEELGISAERSMLKFARSFVRKNSIVDLWYGVMELSIDRLVLQHEEVSKVKWADKTELAEMIETGQFHNYGYDYFETVYGLLKKI